jgi:hypothetical protein
LIAVGHPGDVHFWHASDRRAIMLAHRAARPGCRVSASRNWRASSRSPGRPGLGRVQDDLDVHADTLTHGHRHFRFIERNPVSFLLFSLPITYPRSILA